MVETARRLPFRKETLLALLWAAELGYLAFPEPALANILAAGFVLYVAVALRASRWQTLALCGALALASLGLCLAYGVWPAIITGLHRALIFLAFMPTVMLIRATADRRPEITATRALFASLDPAERGGGLLFGCHVIGSVLSVGVFALLAPIVGPDAPEAERKQVVGVALRGMCLAAMWSPFFVSVGLVSEHLPAVPLWQIMPLGLGLAAIGLTLSYLMFDSAGGTAALARAMRSLVPVVPGVAVAAAVVASLAGMTDLTTLQALAVGMPPLCALALLAVGRGITASAWRATFDGLGNVGGEIAILTFSVVLGAVFEAALGPSGLVPGLAGIEPSAPLIIAATIGIMCVAGLLGVHPIVSATMLLVLLARLPHDVTDLALMLAVLVGWALAAMVSVSGISVVISSALFRIPPERLIRGQNIVFVAIFGTLSVLLIALANDNLPL